MLDQLVLHHLLQIGAFCPELGQAVHHVLNEVETVQVVLHPHVKRGRDGALFLVASDVQVAIGPPVGQAMDEPRISMESENDVLILREQRIVIRRSGHGGVPSRLQFHEIDDIDDPDFEAQKMLAKDGNRSENFQRGRVTAAGQDHIRLSIYRCWPISNSDPLLAMQYRCFHAQPLRQRVFSGDHHIHVVTTS